MSNFSALIATIQANIKTNGQEEITGAILQDVLEAMVQALGIEGINNLETALGQETTNRQNADTALGNSITAIEGKIPSAATSSNKLTDKAYVDAADTTLTNAVNAIKDNIDNGYVYAGIATPSGTPTTGRIFYFAITAGTYTNYGGLVVTQGINILKYDGTNWSQEQIVPFDEMIKAGSDGIPKSGIVYNFVKEHIGLKPYLSYEMMAKNPSRIVRGKYVKYVNSVYQETESAIAAFIKLPIPSGCKTLFIFGGSSNIFSLAQGCYFAGSSNEYIMEGHWTSGNYVANSVMTENIPTNAVYVYVNFLLQQEENVHLFCGLPFLEMDSFLEGCNVSEITNCELFNSNDKKCNCKAYINSSLIWQFNELVGTSTPIKCYEGDIFQISGWCDVVNPPTSYGRNVLYFNKYGEALNYDTINLSTYQVTIPSNVEYVGFLFELQAKNNLSIKRIKSGRMANYFNRNLWNKKTWVAFGDSITEDAKTVKSKWKELVAGVFGFTMYNCGIGSTCFGIKGDYYLDDSAMCTTTRLNEVISHDPDIVTLQGGDNDCAVDIPIGTNAEYTKTLSNKDKNTLKGALSFIIETLLIWKPSLRIVVMTANYGYNDDGASLSALGLTFADYANAMAECAKYYGLPCVDIHSNQGLNALTVNYYTSDGIHWNEYGGKAAASLVISKLKEINNV